MNNLDGKYGEITTSKKQLHPGEPVFLLRAQDPFAGFTVRQYAKYCEDMGCHTLHVQAVYRHAERIEAWQKANPDKVKVRPGPSPEELETTEV